jgi:hypothetical protein
MGWATGSPRRWWRPPMTGRRETEMSHPELTRRLMEARAADMRRIATQHRSRRDASVAPREPPEAPVTLRFARPDDASELAHLAQLDSAAAPAPPALLGELSGRLVAALSLADGRVLADPFVPTAAVVELLRARARQLNGTARGSRARRAPRPLRRWSARSKLAGG